MDGNMTTRGKLIAMEGLAVLAALALLVLAACFLPLEQVGAKGRGGPETAPWVFVGVQELLRFLPAALAAFWLPGLALALLAALPWLEERPWAKWPRLAAWAVLLIWGGLTWLGVWRG